MSEILTRIVGAISNLIQFAVLLLWLFLPGCATGSRVNLSAADALEGLSAEFDRALAEYHDDLGRYDDDREREALSAFVSRVRASNGDESAGDADEAELLAALRKIRTDREMEAQRYLNSRQNTASLVEVSSGLSSTFALFRGHESSG